MKKCGLVLSGGGGKGAYHIGVWKYLKKVGLDMNIKAISGTSVGALNSCLFALNDYELAERIWTSEIKDKILSIDFEDTLKRMAKFPKLNSIITLLTPFIKVLSTTGVFSREGLKSIINEYVDLNFISSMDLPVYACATHINSLKAKYFKLNGHSKEDIKNMLLASSAIPLIFPIQDVQGEEYWDGFIKNNSPIKPLIEYEGCTDVIVIKLEATEILKDRRDDVNIYEICPQENLGNLFTGVLDFSPSGAFKRIEQGYNDAKAVLEPVVNIARAGASKLKTLDMIREDEMRFNKNRKNVLEERARLKENLNKTMDSFLNIEETKKLYIESHKKLNK